MMCVVFRSILRYDLSRAIDSTGSPASCGRGRRRWRGSFEGLAESYKIQIVLEDLSCWDMLGSPVLKECSVAVVSSAMLSSLHVAASVLRGCW